MKQISDLVTMRRAIVSTYDKTDLFPLCKLLSKFGIELIATGNTAKFLTEKGIETTKIETVTGCREILGGRVKTLHPNIFGGILARRNNSSDIETLEIEEIDPIDLVIVNLYPFEKTAATREATHADCIETIDIGGPSLIRAAAKNYDYVTILSDPSQYEEFIRSFEENRGTLINQRKRLAADAFTRTAMYDLAIASYMGDRTLRYGENPHQKSKCLISNNDEIPLAQTAPIHGKELSYNNLLDTHAAILALRCLMETKGNHQGCTIVKHGTPCGASLSLDLPTAARKAFETDPVSAFGGIIALSTIVDENTAEFLKSHFIELIVAPKFSAEAFAVLTQKKNIRLLEIPTLLTAPWPRENIRSIFGGMLLQDVDIPQKNPDDFSAVTKTLPSTEELLDLKIAMALSIPCLSNAITIVKNGCLLGVGAGQTSRVDAVKIAINKAQEHGHNLNGSVLASDGFFPFTDSLKLAKNAGISAIAQPGGSKMDPEVIAEANALGIAMVFTGVRHFRH